MKLSQIVAIRTTFCTNYFLIESKCCVYRLFAPSLLLQFFFTHPVVNQECSIVYNLGVEALTYTGVHMRENRFQKYPQQVLAFSIKTPLNNDFTLFHIKFGPLNLSDL